MVASLLQENLATRGCLSRRSRAQQKGDDEPFHDLLLLEAVAGEADVLKRPLGRVRARPSSAREVVGLSLQAPRPCKAELIAKLLENDDRTLCRVDQLLRRDLRLGEETQKPALHEGVGGQPAVAGRGGALHRLSERPVRPSHVAAQALDNPDVGDELHAQRILRRQQRDGA